MISADLTGVRLDHVLFELEEKGGIRCLTRVRGRERNVFRPHVMVHEPGGPVTIRESHDVNGDSRKVVAVFLPSQEQALRWIKWGDENGVPVFLSLVDVNYLSGKLKGLIREFCEGVKLVHGSLVEIGGRGVIISGPSGSGKTSCVWFLLGRGHLLIADDAVVLLRVSEERLIGRSHEAVKGCVHLRGRGIIRLPENKLSAEAPIFLEVHLIGEGEEETGEVTRCGVRVPRVKMRGRDAREIAGRIEKLIT